jgi:predicted permease
MLTLRSALRHLTRTPFLSAVIVLSLAIGIGANTVVFSWLKQAMLDPLPGVRGPVMTLEVRDDTGGYTSTSWLLYRELIELTPSLGEIAAHRPRNFTLGESDQGVRVFGEFVSHNFFSTLGVAPALGRFFRADEVAAAGGSPVAVISHGLWQRHFQGAPDVLGRELKLNGRPLTVIGVTPAEFRGGLNNLSFEVWVPATMAPQLQPASQELTNRNARAYLMIARLKPDHNEAQLRTELDRAAAKFNRLYPDATDEASYHLLPLWRSPRSGQATVVSLATLQVLSTLLLVVVCANTANLLLARASTRQREIGVRLAIGAGPRRILLQLLGESLLLAFLGAAAGLLLALWGADALRQIPLPAGLPLQLNVTIDLASLAFAAALALGCGVLFGLAPAVSLVRRDVLSALRGGRGLAGGRSRLRDLLVGTEVAVALIVLVVAGLFLKSFHQAQHFPTGYAADEVMLVNVDLGGRGYTEDRARTFLATLFRELEQVPGFVAASAAQAVPLDIRGIPRGNIAVQGRGPDEPVEQIFYYQATPGYFRTMGVDFVEGDDLAPLDRMDLPFDAVVNEEMARRCWPGVSPIGRRFEVNNNWFVVKGVVRTTKYATLSEPPQPAAWVTWRRQFISAPTLHVRARGVDAATQLAAIRAAVQRLDPEVSLVDPRTLAQHFDQNLMVQRVPARLLAVLGPLALALAAIGLYAVIAYSLAQRTQEIGLRMALGSTPHGAVRLFLWQGLRVVLAGAAVGWVGALFAGHLLRNALVGVPFGDPLIYAGVPLLLLGVAALACWLPARRAARIDPMVALRTE